MNNTESYPRQTAVGELDVQSRATFVSRTYAHLFGAILSFFSIRIIGVLFGGWLLPYHYPWLLASQIVPLLLGVGLLAAIYPAFVAQRLEPSLALAYE